MGLPEVSERIVIYFAKVPGTDRGKTHVNMMLYNTLVSNKWVSDWCTRLVSWLDVVKNNITNVRVIVVLVGKVRIVAINNRIVFQIISSKQHKMGCGGMTER
jgi:hypothetical protein